MSHSNKRPIESGSDSDSDDDFGPKPIESTEHSHDAKTTAKRVVKRKKLLNEKVQIICFWKF